MFCRDYVEIMPWLSLDFSQIISNMSVMLLVIQFCKTVQRITFLYHYCCSLSLFHQKMLEIILYNNNNDNNYLFYQPYHLLLLVDPNDSPKI